MIEKQTGHKIIHVIEQTLPHRVNYLDYCIGHLSAHLPSRNSIKKAIKRQELLVNQAPIAWDGVAKKGDQFWWKRTERIHKVFPLELDVLFEDDHLAIVNKPAGFAVSGNAYKTIKNALPHNLSPSSQLDALGTPLPVHRLDAQTSGVLVIAKTHQAVGHLGKQFEDQTIQKTYLCIVKGNFPMSQHCSLMIEEQAAETQFELVEQFTNQYLGELSLVKAFPKTGRTHQIRKHLLHLTFPILGDKIYGEYFNKGLFLSAVGLNLLHPITSQHLSMELRIPNKFQNLLNHIK